MFGRKKKVEKCIETKNELFGLLFPALDDSRDLDADMELATRTLDSNVSVCAESDMISIKTGAGSHSFTYPEASVIYSMLSVLYTTRSIRK